MAKPTATTLRPITAPTEVESWYRQQLQDMLRAMRDDLARRLRRPYRKAAEHMALDDDPIVVLRTVMRLWGRLWTKRFDDMAKQVAEMFANRSQRNLDAAFRSRLRAAGFTVKFRPTERMVSAYRAVIAEQVGLIKSIPQQYLKDVEGAVWRSTMKGGAMGRLSTDLRQKYGVSYRRAALIARDQNAKAKATFDRERRLELGITTAVWVHSHAGKVPRPSHVRMDGERFEVAKGMWDPDEQQWIQPGELVNCRCTSRSVMPGSP